MILKEGIILNTYKFEITEILQRTVCIAATDEKEAYEIIKRKYKEEDIVLDSSDFIESEIKIIE